MNDITTMLNTYSQSKWGNYNQVGGSTSTMGGSGNVGGDWTGVEQWSSQINSASAKFGVPANLIKAVMMRESGGQNLAINDSFAVGPMQVTTNNWGNLGYDLYDPNENIMAGAAVLKQMYDSMGNWEGAVRAYLAGPGGAYSSVTDSFGTDPASYWKDISAYWNTLNSSMGSAGLGSGSGSGGSLQSAFGTGVVPDWGEYDKPSDLGYYSYGADYGLSGTTHTGVDVPMAFGAPMKAAFSGTVTCGGTGIGPGADGGGCAAFGYDPNFAGAGQAGQGSGRIEILSDDGNVMLIYGHASGSAVTPGQRVSAGDLVGYNGGMNSAHVHLEARVRDASLPSGWRIVDPRTVMGGGTPGMGPISGGFSTGSVVGDRWASNRRGQAMSGAPSIYGRWSANRG